MRSVTKDLLITAFAAITSVLTAYLLALVDTNIHFALYGFTLWFVFPAGAIACGAAAASGYWAGFQVFPHRMTKLVMVNAVALSIVAYFVIYYWDYSMLTV